MKTSALSMLIVLLSSILQAQNYFEIRSLEKSEVLNTYQTVDETGNAMELLAAIKVTVNHKECDKNGLPLYLKSEEKKEYNRPKLYCWNTMLRCWQKSVEVQRMSGTGPPIYVAKVKCPGIYAFFDSGVKNSSEKGVLVSMPTRCEIRSVRIIQQSPAYANSWVGNGTNEVKLSFGPLQFDAVLEVSWEENGKNNNAKFLCGGLTRLESINEGQYRLLEIKPGKSMEYQSTQFTNNSY
jgi:hypothetical protein